MIFIKADCGCSWKKISQTRSWREEKNTLLHYWQFVCIVDKRSHHGCHGKLSQQTRNEKHDKAIFHIVAIDAYDKGVVDTYVNLPYSPLDLHVVQSKPTSKSIYNQQLYAIRNCMQSCLWVMLEYINAHVFLFIGKSSTYKRWRKKGLVEFGMYAQRLW